MNLEDTAELAAPMNLQLVLLPFSSTSAEAVAELAMAASRGCAAEVEAILQRPEDPNVLHGASGPLYAACQRKHVEIVRLLLEAGTDVEQLSKPMGEL